MIRERLERLRAEMRAEGIDAMIFPSSDPHNSEYVAPHWQARRWVSGFDGSAGTAVVTLDEAALWTDSRYFLQADKQLAGTGYLLMKDGIATTPAILQWLKQKLSATGGTCVAVDGMVMTYDEVEAMRSALRRIGVTLRTNYDAMRMVWRDRPAIPQGEIYEVRRDLVGESVSEKLTRVRQAMREERCEAHVVTDLMSIAWLLNLRGSDVSMTPVFLANIFIGTDRAVVFCNGQLTDGARKVLTTAGVEVKRYGDFADFLRRNADRRIMCDSHSVCHTVYSIVKDCAVDMPSPLMVMKAIKNDREIEGFRQSMLRDGVAMVKFLRWLKPAVAAGGQTEISVSDHLEALRREAPEFRDLSFSTICGYQANGAIVHYTATAESNATLRPEGLLLLDSGAQYVDGTTDITRTIALGEVTEEMQQAYTLVLKAHIALAMVRFPEGTNGTQIDAIARSVLWRSGMNYLHGTGHGVGWCLGVHEGPHCIRMEWRPQPLCAGMTVTNEPGVYLAERFGVRTENTMLVVKAGETEFGVFLQLQPLTLCPIDTAPIIREMLTTEEAQWLDDYHLRVRETLLPLLTDEADRAWLIENTQRIMSD